MSVCVCVCVCVRAAVVLSADRMSLQVSAGHPELNSVKWMLSESG